MFSRALVRRSTSNLRQAGGRRPVVERLLLGKAAILLLLTACVAPENDDGADLRHYACELGVSFSASFQGDEVVVLTKSGSHHLQRRSGSIGVRYGSDTVAFAQDEERAVLVGADDGPYRGCMQVGPALAAAGWNA